MRLRFSSRSLAMRASSSFWRSGLEFAFALLLARGLLQLLFPLRPLLGVSALRSRSWRSLLLALAFGLLRSIAICASVGACLGGGSAVLGTGAGGTGGHRGRCGLHGGRRGHLRHRSPQLGADAGGRLAAPRDAERETRRSARRARSARAPCPCACRPGAAASGRRGAEGAVIAISGVSSPGDRQADTLDARALQRVHDA